MIEIHVTVGARDFDRVIGEIMQIEGTDLVSVDITDPEPAAEGGGVRRVRITEGGTLSGRTLASFTEDGDGLWKDDEEDDQGAYSLGDLLMEIDAVLS